MSTQATNPLSIFDPNVVWEAAEAQIQKMENTINDYNLTNYNNAVENHKTIWGTNANQPDPPGQPNKIHLQLYRKTEATEPNLIVTEGPEKLGEPYVPPGPDWAPGTIKYGPLVPELSTANQSVYNDSASSVPLGTVDTRPDPDGRTFVLVEADDGRRYWYQTA